MSWVFFGVSFSLAFFQRIPKTTYDITLDSQRNCKEKGLRDRKMSEFPWRTRALFINDFPNFPFIPFASRDDANERLTAFCPREIKCVWQRLTFPFPFVHHQSHDWKVDHNVLGLVILPDFTILPLVSLSFPLLSSYSLSLGRQESYAREKAWRWKRSKNKPMNHI